MKPTPSVVPSDPSTSLRALAKQSIFLATGKKERTSFLKKRRPARGSKKLLVIWASGRFTNAVQINKSFLLPRAGSLFFKKEVLASFPATP
jgi:hypothetical protein